MFKLLSAIVLEVVIYSFYLVSLVLSYLISLDKNIKQNKKKTILLHGGWFSRGLFYILMKKRLENLGYKVYVPDYGYHFGRIEEIAGSLDKYIKGNKIKKFVFIGHSLGGLVGLYYYKNYKNNIIKFISIGTPFYGTWLARVSSVFSESAKQMIPGSLFLKKLHKGRIAKNIYTLGSKHDQYVSVKSSQLRKDNHITIEGVGHLSLLFSNKVFQEIKKVL